MFLSWRFLYFRFSLHIIAFYTLTLFCTLFPSTMTFTIIFHTMTFLTPTSWPWISFWKNWYFWKLIVATISAGTFWIASFSSLKAFTIVLLTFGFRTVAFYNSFRSLIFCWIISFRHRNRTNIKIKSRKVRLIIIFNWFLLDHFWFSDQLIKKVTLQQWVVRKFIFIEKQ